MRDSCFRHDKSQIITFYRSPVISYQPLDEQILHVSVKIMVQVTSIILTRNITSFLDIKYSTSFSRKDA